MVITALVIGALVAYYFGVNAGAVAAAVSAGLILAAKLPGMWLIAHAVLVVGVVAVCFIGPKMKKKKGTIDHIGWVWKKLRRK